MKTPKDILIRSLRFIYRAFTRKMFLPPDCECNRQIANDMIYELLASDKPCMIARFGANELSAMLNCLSVKKVKESLLKE